MLCQTAQLQLQEDLNLEPLICESRVLPTRSRQFHIYAELGFGGKYLNLSHKHSRFGHIHSHILIMHMWLHYNLWMMLRFWLYVYWLCLSVWQKGKINMESWKEKKIIRCSNYPAFLIPAFDTLYIWCLICLWGCSAAHTLSVFQRTNQCCGESIESICFCA